jgi:exodeoxyribonuclease-5
MILTRNQEEGLKTAIARYNNKEAYTCIAGYAGTGKSTLVQFIISALNIPEERVVYIAYTGKAAQVLRTKGCPNAMTAHRLLYQSFPKKDGTFTHIPIRPLYPYKIIVVDEVSMLPKHMWELLLSHKIHVLALGDPGQLPPVAAEPHGVLDHPHIFLDEIMRQAQESEIIRLTMDIRAQKPLQLMRGNEVRIVDRDEMLNTGFLAWADQILVGKNDTRFAINSFMREVLMNTDDPHPLVGDRIICLKNNWECINETGDALVNGLSGTITNLTYTRDNPFMEVTPIADFTPDYDNAKSFLALEMDYKIFMEHEPTINKDNFKRIPKYYQPNQFDYAYAITCHKSQGSEYDKVIVLEEYLKGDSKEEHARWLYTAATRAAKKLIIVRNYHK